MYNLKQQTQHVKIVDKKSGALATIGAGGRSPDASYKRASIASPQRGARILEGQRKAAPAVHLASNGCFGGGVNLHHLCPSTTLQSAECTAMEFWSIKEYYSPIKYRSGLELLSCALFVTRLLFKKSVVWF